MKQLAHCHGQNYIAIFAKRFRKLLSELDLIAYGIQKICRA
ncbi:MAG: hypothetical protein A4E46_00418 [Methanosaeta sp. PtaU1.Bin016]|nr:MAG: hypothetical protein A4E46_00418 [Methanosaeta sp. PtaU1.Bin016]